MTLCSGAYHGKRGFETFSHERAVLSRPYLLDAPQRYPPYTPGNAAFFRFALLHLSGIDSFKLQSWASIMVLVALAAWMARTFM